MLILTASDIRDITRHIGLEQFINRATASLKQDFGRWDSYCLSPRYATYFPQGVIELMPCSDNEFYTFKYVNGHPGNVLNGKLSVAAIGQISDAGNGYPLMLCDMTLLTAIRTAATSMLAASYLARSTAKSLAVIGTGAQAEFQTVGFAGNYALEKIFYFDIDSGAMVKYARNLAGLSLDLIPCGSILEAVHGADIVTTATAAKHRQMLFGLQEIAPGTHINAIGGDCPGKTELPAQLLRQVKLVVEYTPQSLIEGEIQQGDAGLIHAELAELVCGTKIGRDNNREITLFDSVGFALEDFSILRIVYKLVTEFKFGTEIAMLPEVEDPKDLFGFLAS
ncbi:ornithine cyclodeaminase [Methylotuvimicrobium sp. KM2]|uniref:ornithine cyclodeaminase n=1 Tax=Methylotuvimicrobium sp. KM2 TaxID=3133976 RepID=UPI0031018C57